MQMHRRPIVLHKIDERWRFGICRADLFIKAPQHRDGDRTGLTIDDAPGARIQRRDNAALGSAPTTAARERLNMAACFIVRRDGGMMFIGHLILKQHHDPCPRRPTSPKSKLTNALEFRNIIRIRAMNIRAGALIDDPETSQYLTDPNGRPVSKPRTDALKFTERPVASGDVERLRITSDHMEQVFTRLIRRPRGKKRACARVLA